MNYKISNNSPVVLGFSLICVAEYFINTALGGIFKPLFIAPAFPNPAAISFYLQSILYIFGHASLEHLSGNLMLFLLIGPIIEEKYGSRQLIGMIAVTAITTSAINMLFLHNGILGASGIVFMLILLISFTNVEKGKIPITFILIFVLYIGKEVLNSFHNNEISQFGHITGGICGSIFGFKTNHKR